MYEVNTILELKERRSTPEEPFPYDEVRVVGTSPIDPTAGARSGWEGADATGVIIQPITEFGSTLDEPFGKLRALYDVKELPPETEVETPKIKVIDAQSAAAGATPEEVFAEEAPGIRSEDGKRGRTPHSPLPDPREESQGPLGKVEPDGH